MRFFRVSGLCPGQILWLLKPVYGRPDAPRAWFDELSSILQTEVHFQQSSADPALFMLRGEDQKLRGLLIVHVDDVMFCHDGSSMGEEATAKLQKRFPFETWQNVAQQQAEVTCHSNES